MFLNVSHFNQRQSYSYFSLLLYLAAYKAERSLEPFFFYKGHKITFLHFSSDLWIYDTSKPLGSPFFPFSSFLFLGLLKKL